MLRLIIIFMLIPAIANATNDNGEIYRSKDEGTIFIELEADTLSPYLQAQTLITLKLYRDPDSFDAAMSYPELTDPIINRNVMLRNIEVNERRYRQYKDNRLYTVTERQYVVYPEQSGHMRIGPSIFKGHIVQGGTIEFVQVESNILELDVRPIPDSFTGNIWIPARSIKLYQDFQPTDDALELGKPLSRNLFISATGLGSGHIPSFHSEQTPGFRVYPRQTKREELEHAESGLIAVLQQELAMVPTAIGEFEIPEIKVPWWNTIKDKEEVASFPGKKITILPVAGSEVLHESRERQEHVHHDNGLRKAVVKHFEQRPLLSLLIFCVVILLIYFAFVFASRLPQFKLRKHKQKQSMLRKALTACYNNQADDAAQFIIAYATMSSREMRYRSLLDVSDDAEGEMKNELLILNGVLYSPNLSNWDGEKLAELLKQWVFKADVMSVKTIPEHVPELHPLATGKIS